MSLTPGGPRSVRWLVQAGLGERSQRGLHVGIRQAASVIDGFPGSDVQKQELSAGGGCILKKVFILRKSGDTLIDTSSVSKTW